MATAELATAWIRLQPSFEGVKAQISKEIGGASAVADKAGADAGNRYVSGAKKNLVKLGGVLAGAFAVSKIVDGMNSAISAASDLAEAGTAVGAVFGDSFGDIEKWSKAAAKSLGQSQLEALNAAKTFGIYGQSAGLAGEANVEFSTGLAELATDLASFHNTSPEEAVLALGAALRGENEPIRRFGILLDDATLRQKALAMGLIETTKDALTPQQKVLAAHAAILEQSAVAQGDFARTSDGLANQQRILNAEWENFSAELGEVLLPTLSNVVTKMTEDVIPALKDMLSALKDLQEQEWFAKLNEELASGGSLDLATGGFVENFKLKWEQLPESFANGWEQIKEGNRVASDEIGAQFEQSAADWGAKFANGREQINTGVTQWWDGLIASFANGWTQITAWWNGGWDGFGAKLDNGRTQINDGVTWLWDQITGAFSNGWTQISAPWVNGWEQIRSVFSTAADKIKGIAEGVAGTFASVAQTIRDAFDGIGQFISDAFGPIGDFLGGAGNAIRNFFGGTGDAARHIKGKLQAATVSGAGGGGAALARVRSSLPSGLSITDTLSSPARDAMFGLQRSANSYHYDANNPAVDIAGPIPLLHQYARQLAAMGGWRQFLWQVPGHYDHIHVAHSGGVVSPSWYRSPGDRADERTVRLQVGETVLPRSWSGDPGIGAGSSFEGMSITGTLEIGGDGLARIVDGRIQKYDKHNERATGRGFAPDF